MVIKSACLAIRNTTTHRLAVEITTLPPGVAAFNLVFRFLRLPDKRLAEWLFGRLANASATFGMARAMPTS